MTIDSFNVPFYWMTKEMGPEKVVAVARDAGIRTMWTDEDEVINLAEVEPSAVAPSKFDVEVGFGQYKVKVIEHVNGLATLANRGSYNKAHFVVSVEKKRADGEWVKVNGEQIKPEKKFDTEQIDSMLKVLQKIPGAVTATTTRWPTTGRRSPSPAPGNSARRAARTVTPGIWARPRR